MELLQATRVAVDSALIHLTALGYASMGIGRALNLRAYQVSPIGTCMVLRVLV